MNQTNSCCEVHKSYETLQNDNLILEQSLIVVGILRKANKRNFIKISVVPPSFCKSDLSCSAFFPPISNQGTMFPYLCLNEIQPVAWLGKSSCNYPSPKQRKKKNLIINGSQFSSFIPQTWTLRSNPSDIWKIFKKLNISVSDTHPKMDWQMI